MLHQKTFGTVYGMCLLFFFPSDSQSTEPTPGARSQSLRKKRHDEDDGADAGAKVNDGSRRGDLLIGLS